MNRIKKIDLQYTPDGQGQNILITRADGQTRKYKYSQGKVFDIISLTNIYNCWCVRWDDEGMKREAIR